MTATLTSNTQAILLLTAPLVAGRGDASRDLLSLGEYNRLARVLREKQKQPADLLGPDAKELIDACGQIFGRPRIEALLGRGFLLSQALERWSARALWVLSRAEATYPKRLKTRLKEDAPPVLYGCGDVTLLDNGGLAVVGSRHVDDELIRYTENVGRIAASHHMIISGGAKGIDRAAMMGALREGGQVAGVLADSLERAALGRENRDALMDGRLVLISPYDPAAGFNVGHAMQRNKIVYALADAALVVTSDLERGGTWAGAIEQLERLRFVPVFVRDGSNAGKGNAALLKRGAPLWPDPKTNRELDLALRAGLEFADKAPQQDSLPFAVRENAALDNSAPLATPALHEAEPALAPAPNCSAESAAADQLLGLVRDILVRALTSPETEERVSALLDVTKPQAKVWLTRLVAEGVLERVGKSRAAQYRTVKASERLL